jgi:hypothetical protein
MPALPQTLPGAADVGCDDAPMSPSGSRKASLGSEGPAVSATSPPAVTSSPSLPCMLEGPTSARKRPEKSDGRLGTSQTACFTAPPPLLLRRCMMPSEKSFEGKDTFLTSFYETRVIHQTISNSFRNSAPRIRRGTLKSALPRVMISQTLVLSHVRDCA